MDLERWRINLRHKILAAKIMAAKYMADFMKIRNILSHKVVFWRFSGFIGYF